MESERTWQQDLSHGLDIVPILGGVKATFQMTLGIDVVTGHDVSRGWNAAMAALNFLPMGGLPAAGERVLLRGAEEGGTSAIDSLMAQVRAADFATPRNGAVFWTGYRQGN